MFSVFRSQSKLFKDLEFLGYDPVIIKEVLKTHKTFESALEKLNSLGCKKISKQLIDSGIPNRAAQYLADRFDCPNKAIIFYNSYQSQKDIIISQLIEMGFDYEYADYCIMNFWDIEEAINNIRLYRPSSMREERKRDPPPQLVVERNENSMIRFSINTRGQGNQVTFDVDRSSIRENFEEMYDTLSTNMRRNSIMRRSSRYLESPNPTMPSLPRVNNERTDDGLHSNHLPPPPPSMPTPLPPPQISNNNPGPINPPDVPRLNPIDMLFLNIQLIESISNGDDATAIIILRILSELCPQPHLEDSEISSFPKFQFSPSLKLLNDNCTICYEDFTRSSQVIKLPCDHCFDSECITTWLKNSVVCPLCKHNLKSS